MSVIVAYGYALVPAGESADPTLSLDAQRADLRAYYDRRLAGHGVLWGDVYADRGAACRLPLADRPAGKCLADRIRKGDHLLLVRLDRGFRHLADAFERLTRWLEGGVHVHLVRQGLDTSAVASGPFGVPFLRTLAVLAEFKRQQTPPAPARRSGTAAARAAWSTSTPATATGWWEGAAAGARSQISRNARSWPLSLSCTTSAA